MNSLYISRLRGVAHAMVERDNREQFSLYQRITGEMAVGKAEAGDRLSRPA